ncbi:diaminobutyrate acetyltransferase [bacterium]|nr:diaminobutyrate acetyltransferase [bacterium]
MQEPVSQEFTLRPPTIDDAAAIWQLVRDSGVLDENSAYAYLLLCRDFARTSLVAESESQVAGFVTAYRPPLRPQVLFVWQIGVSPSARRQGLGVRLLLELVSRSRKDGPAIDFVEATVAASNVASSRLFDALAKTLAVPLTKVEGFTEAHFPPGGHEAEPLIRIGPLPGL